MKALSAWPVLPIILQYGGFPTLGPPSLEDEHNVVAMLKQSDCVRSISLTITSSLLAQLTKSPIEEPFLNLEDLSLLSNNPMGLALPSSFKWGSCLHHLHSTRIVLPALPQLLLPSRDLIDLQLHEIPGVGYFSPDAFTGAFVTITLMMTANI